ncbi:MAG: ATP-grasp domain-containing protein [Sneathiella sp.]|nr:ATP-grasp domain-containing protein [Sneathiella sp.]
MLTFKVIEVQALRGLNLVAPMPGLFCRIRIEEQDINIPDAVCQKLAKCLTSVVGDNTEVVAAVMARKTDNAAVFLANFFSQFVLAVQNAVGSNVSVVRQTLIQESREWHVFTEYEHETIGRRATLLTLKVMDQVMQDSDRSLSLGDQVIEISKEISSINKEYVSTCPGQDMQEFTALAESRRIPWHRPSQKTQHVLFGYGKHQQIFHHSIIGTESHNSAELANSKAMTTKLLERAGIPVARQILVGTEQGALQAAKKIGFPVVVKPIAGTQGYGITPNIKTAEELKHAFTRARPYHRKYIVEKHIAGDDYRLLVIGGEYVGCLKRSISVVTGDGNRTIEALVTELNKEPWRSGVDGRNKFHVRKLDVITECLKDQGYDWNSIPRRGAVVKLHIVPNISQGGSCREIRDEVHPENIKMAERAASVLKLNVAGIDYLTTDISRPYWETGGRICEVNVCPTIGGMFRFSPTDLKGIYRKAFELNFPPHLDVSLPVIITLGEEGRVADKVVHFLSKQGVKVGYKANTHTEIDGSPLIIQNKGLAGAHAVLWNGLVDAAVISEDVHSIRRFGLGYSQSTLIIIEAMPNIDGASSCEILELLLKTNPQFVLLNGSDRQLMDWAEEIQDPRIIRVTANENELIEETLYHRSVEELGFLSNE